MGRSAIAIMSTENLFNNLKVIKQRARGSKIIAMVKANAYGHGLRSVSSRVERHVDMLGVASIDEALALRKIGINIPILLMEGVFESNELTIASVEGFHIVFHSEYQIQWAEKFTYPLLINAWIKVNTGLGRLGFNVEQGKRAFDRLMLNSRITKPIKILSHLACADDFNHIHNNIQIEEFKKFIKNIDSEYSLCNSAGLFQFPEYNYQYVRPGLALYGGSPVQGRAASEFGLKPVMTLQSSFISIQNMKKGDIIGYSGLFTCPEEMLVGIIAFGYGDGYPITTNNGTPVLVNGIKCPIIGRVSMDMMAIDLRECPKVQIGDAVILWGEGLPVEVIAECTNTITHSILTSVQNRVKFYWTKYSPQENLSQEIGYNKP